MLSKFPELEKIVILSIYLTCWNQNLRAMRSMPYKILTLVVSLIWIGGCEKPSNPNYQEDVSNPEYFHQSVKKLTDVIVHDIFSPPVASRIYAYSSIAAYEAMVPGHPEYRSLADQVNGLKDVPQPNAGEEYSFSIAGLQALLMVGKTFIFSEDKIEEFHNILFAKIKNKGVPEDVFERSLAYGDSVGKHILAWASEDNYKQTRTFPKFEITTSESSRWQPTPPSYMDAIEPHWSKIRTFVLDSANQFIPPPPTKFNMKEGSDFYKEAYEIYEIGENLSNDQEAIAKFWDCNPYVAHLQGHLMFATKKITPGGHWMGVTAIASRKAKADMMKTAEAYVMTSISLADGFISCWDEKFRSNLIRPETVINQYIDPDWAPVLQTPPFPEYTSGHSVISSAAAIALTHVYGEPFQYTDTTEVEYGLPPRSFNSFIEASEEAAVSRMYGGIHYRPACEVGIQQGRSVGRFVVKTIHTRKDESVAENSNYN